MKTLRDRLAELDTSSLSDALDRLAIDGQAVGITPLDRSFHVVGQAFTVRMLPRGRANRSATTSTTSPQARSWSSTTKGGSTPPSGATS